MIHQSITASRRLPDFQLAQSTSIYIVAFLLLFLASINSVLANDSPVIVPENATVKSYGDGWSCNVGYREVNGACAMVKVPDHAYPTYKSYGKGWECKRGYLSNNDVCNYIKIPVNGYLDYNGIRVKCDRGYYMKNKLCELVKVPDNAYLNESSYEPGWTCERGYQMVKKGCVALKVPENAHIGFSGKSWECDKPYTKKLGKCILQSEYR